MTCPDCTLGEQMVGYPWGTQWERCPTCNGTGQEKPQ